MLNGDLYGLSDWLIEVPACFCRCVITIVSGDFRCCPVGYARRRSILTNRRLAALPIASIATAAMEILSHTVLAVSESAATFPRSACKEMMESVSDCGMEVLSAAYRAAACCRAVTSAAAVIFALCESAIRK